jgi:cytochrome c oxidase cbb3-type subunit 4
MTMDIGLIRGLITVTLLALFIGLWFWSWSRKRQPEYEAASQLPLEEDTDHPPADNKEMEQDS